MPPPGRLVLWRQLTAEAKKGQGSSDEKKWAITIVRLKDNGHIVQDTDPDFSNVFHIVQEEWETDPEFAPIVDHMHLDDSDGVEWLFGSTRAWTEGYSVEGRVYLWKVKLDFLNHDPDPAALVCFKL